MFGIGPMELAVIAIVALIFVGPKRLPEVMRKMGKAFVQVRRQTQDIRETMSGVMRDAERELELERIRELKEKMNKLNPQEMLKSAINDDGSKKNAEKRDDDHDFHEGHYIDGEYKNPDEGFLDARLLEDNGWKHLRPQENTAPAETTENTASVPLASSGEAKPTDSDAKKETGEPEKKN